MAKTLTINGRLTVDGFDVIVEKRKFPIRYDKKIWRQTPLNIRQILCDNITFGLTNVLPLILNKAKINYQTNFPWLESFLFKNQLYDLLSCEKADHVLHLSYLRRFYNLEYNFGSNNSIYPDTTNVKKFTNRQPTAVIPFTFGKESLATFALCLELSIQPVLVYCQEPAHPYEEKYKLKKLQEIKKKYSIPVYIIKNAAGLFRYGLAFGLTNGTEIGWGAQTTLLSLLMIPFVYAHQAQMILYGSEYSNNESELYRAWRLYPSYDQTSHWMIQQDNMIRLLTNNQCRVHSSLESLEEISIFYLLHHRYTKIGQYQFSCGAAHPLYGRTQWCHRCYKCARMFLFARALDIDPGSIGFNQDLLQKPGMFNHYFGADYKSGSPRELDFAFYLAHKKGVLRKYTAPFVTKKLGKLKSWKYYQKHFTTLHSQANLPPKYRQRLLKIFNQELGKLKNNINSF